MARLILGDETAAQLCRSFGMSGELGRSTGREHVVDYGVLGSLVRAMGKTTRLETSDAASLRRQTALSLNDARKATMPNDDVGRHAEHTHACTGTLPHSLSAAKLQLPLASPSLATSYPVPDPETMLTTATCHRGKEIP